MDTAITVVIPTYNERATLGEVLDGVLALRLAGLSVWVVDDSSPDGTADVVRSRQIHHEALHLLVRPEATGRGPAVVDAMRKLVASSGEPGSRLLIEMDGDGSHDPEAIPAMLACAVDGADVVLGSRYVSGGVADLSRRRRTLSVLANGFARSVLGLPYADCSTGFRCYRTAALARFDLTRLRSRGHATHLELLYHLHRDGARIEETPIRYSARRAGRSKVHAGTVAATLGELLVLRSRSLAGSRGPTGRRLAR